MRAAQGLFAAVLIAGLVVVAAVGTGRGPAPPALSAPDLVTVARRLTDEGRYQEAIGVVDQLLAVDPRNDYARGVRPLLVDKMAFVRQRALTGTSLPSSSPHEGLRYPPDWPDISAIRDQSAARERSGNSEERAIQAQLDRKIPEVNFPGIAFADAIDFLRDVSGTNIFVNWKALETAGIDRNLPVTARLFNVRFSKALALTLQSASTQTARLAYTIDDGVISISTQKDLDRNTLTQVYDVRDLLPPQPKAPAPGAAYPLLSPPGANSAGANSASANAPAVSSPAAAQRKAAADGLITALQQQVDPPSWRDNGGDIGSVEELAGQLIVTQSAQNQQAVAAHLDRLRHRRTSMAKVNDVACWAVPSVLLVLVGALGVRRHRSARWRAAGRCRGCGYDLRASVGRCPECGEAIPKRPERRAAAVNPAAVARPATTSAP